MKLEFFDSNIMLGSPYQYLYQCARDADALLAEMDRRGIGKALVWHAAQCFASPRDGNRLAAEAVARSVRLSGCWTVLPPVTGEVGGPGFFEEMGRHGLVALRAFPEPHNYLLNRTSFGTFLDEVSERGIPFMISPERGITWQGIYDLMKEYPNLTCVVYDVGIWSRTRFLWPLLDTYPRLHVETGMLSIQAGGLEETVKRFGSERLLFGSGFPMRYPEAAMLQLAHADIPDTDKQRIAADNLEELIAGVKL